MTLRRLVAALGLATLVVLSPATTASAATDDPGGGAAGPTSRDGGEGGSDLVSFGIAPASAERPDDRPYVAVTAAPGSVVYEHVAVLNQSDVPLDLDVYAGDVIMAEGGGLSVTSRDEVPYETGTWLGIDGPTTLTVPAQTAETGYGYVVVPVTITIPENATPGDHVAGLVAALTTTGQGGANAPDLELEQRVAARIYVHVTGDVTPGLLVTDVHATWTRTGALGLGSVAVSYTLQNTGNIAMAVEPSVTVAGPFGLRPVPARADRVDLLLPGSATQQTVTVDDVWALVRESVTIDAAAVAPAAGQDPGLGTVSASVTLWAVPWLAVAVLALVLVFVTWRSLARRARRRRWASAPAGTRRARRAAEPGPGAARALDSERSGRGETTRTSV